MSRWKDPAQRTLLRGQLVDAAQTSMVNMFRHPGGADQAKYVALAQAAEALEPGKWREHDYNGALRQSVWRAINQLSGTDGPDRQYSCLSWREIGLTLFGFENVEPAGEGKKSKSYDRQRQALVDRSVQGWSGSTYDLRVFKPFFDLLADKFASLEPQDPGVEAVDHGSYRPTETILAQTDGFMPEGTNNRKAEYIHRYQIEAAFGAARETGAAAIVFVGQAGMGKTWLARALAVLPNGARAPRVRFRAGVPDAFDVQRAMAACGVDEIIMADEQAVYHLLSLCSGPMAPSIIVLDNLDSADEIFALLGDGTKSTVVATCRVRGGVRSPEYRFIRVGHMSEDEAVKLVYSHLTWSNEADAAHLAKLLHGFPLAISHACTLIARSGWSLDEFDREFAKSRAAIVGKLTTEDQTGLLVILDRMLSLLRTSSPLAYSVLGHVVNELMHGAIATKGTVWQLSRTYFGIASTGGSEQVASISRYEFEDAVFLLVDYSLIELNHAVDIYNLPLVKLTIHPLVLDQLIPRFRHQLLDHTVHVRAAVGCMLVEAGCRVGGNIVVVRLEAEDLTTFFVFVRSYGYIPRKAQSDRSLVEYETHSRTPRPPYIVTAVEFTIAIAEPRRSLFAVLFEMMSIVREVNAMESDAEAITVEVPAQLPHGYWVNCQIEVDLRGLAKDEREEVLRTVCIALLP